MVVGRIPENSDDAGCNLLSFGVKRDMERLPDIGLPQDAGWGKVSFGSQLINVQYNPNPLYLVVERTSCLSDLERIDPHQMITIETLDWIDNRVEALVVTEIGIDTGSESQYAYLHRDDNPDVGRCILACSRNKLEYLGLKNYNDKRCQCVMRIPFYLDSGATCHMSPLSYFLEDYAVGGSGGVSFGSEKDTKLLDSKEYAM